MTDSATVTQMSPAEFVSTAHSIEEQVGKVIVGQQEVVRGILTCVLAGGHALLEGVPGLGKTMLIRTLGQALDLSFSPCLCLFFEPLQFLKFSIAPYQTLLNILNFWQSFPVQFFLNGCQQRPCKQRIIRSLIFFLPISTI